LCFRRCSGLDALAKNETNAPDPSAVTSGRAGRMAGKRGGAGRASPRAAKARRADEPAVAAARRAALDGELDETMALRLFLAGGDRGKCGRTCKGNAKRVDCVCGLVPPVDGFRRTGLWRRDTDALVSEAVGVNPSTLARASRAVPVGLRNLGNTCYVNAAIQCVFAIQTFREEVLALDPGDDPSVAEDVDTRGGVSTGADTVSAGAAYAGASHDDARASAPEAPSPPKKKRRRTQKRHRRAPKTVRVDGRRRPRRRRPAAVRGRAVPGDRRAAGRTGVPEAAAGVSGQGRRAGALRLRREGRTRTRSRRRGAPGTRKQPRDSENKPEATRARSSPSTSAVSTRTPRRVRDAGARPRRPRARWTSTSWS
jgi:hypothetical protein